MSWLLRTFIGVLWSDGFDLSEKYEKYDLWKSYGEPKMVLQK